MKFLIQVALSAFILTSATASFAETRDCFEKINRSVFSLNQGLDRLYLNQLQRIFLPSECNSKGSKKRDV